MASFFADPSLRPALDEGFYSLKANELVFFKTQTGISDPGELKCHIIEVQKKAFTDTPAFVVSHLQCRNLTFLQDNPDLITLIHPSSLKITQSLVYDRLVEMPREHEGAIFLDIGCCFGTDIRKVVADGWPVENVIGSDLRKEFWEYGHDLFKSSPTSFPAAFVGGDAFELISPRPPFYTEPETSRPNLQDLSSLSPLQGHISAIHASFFFHLFSEEKQLELARRVATLLSTTLGSFIFGSHLALPEKGFRTAVDSKHCQYIMFCHSPETWKELWDGQVFKKGSVRVDTKLDKLLRLREDSPYTTASEKKVETYILSWSVTRI